MGVVALLAAFGGVRSLGGSAGGSHRWPFNRPGSEAGKPSIERLPFRSRIMAAAPWSAAFHSSRSQSGEAIQRVGSGCGGATGRSSANHRSNGHGCASGKSRKLGPMPTPARDHSGINFVLRSSPALRAQIAPGAVERPRSGESELLSDRFRSTVPGLGEVGDGRPGHPRLLRREGPGPGEIPNGAENFPAGCSAAVGTSDGLQNRSRQPVD